MKTMKAQKAEKGKTVPVSVISAEGQMKGKNAQGKAKEDACMDSPIKITHSMIAQRAWSIWKTKGCIPGQDKMNWEQAELELNLEQRKE